MEKAHCIVWPTNEATEPIYRGWIECFVDAHWSKLAAVRGFVIGSTVLEKENGLDVILQRLDKQWQYDEKVEMPEAFEKYFFKMNRQPGQTVLVYCTECAQALRELTKYEVKIPDEVAGRSLLRRSGLTKEQKQLIQTTVGVKLKVAEVEKALYTIILGQDHASIPAGQRQSNFHGGRRWRNERVQ